VLGETRPYKEIGIGIGNLLYGYPLSNEMIPGFFDIFASLKHYFT
jgi:hypothetical protein